MRVTRGEGATRAAYEGRKGDTHCAGNKGGREEERIGDQLDVPAGSSIPSKASYSLLLLPAAPALVTEYNVAVPDVTWSLADPRAVALPLLLSPSFAGDRSKGRRRTK